MARNEKLARFTKYIELGKNRHNSCFFGHWFGLAKFGQIVGYRTDV